MENLYNEAYSLLPMEEKKEILENLAKKYNMELLRFETFSKYSKSTFTAVFKYKESEFVFVPGDTVTLGYEGLPKNLSNESLDQLKYFSKNPNEFLEELKDFDSDLLKDYNEFKSSDYNRLTLDETARFTKVGNDIEIELYDDISYEELCENLKDEGFSLANLDEWEYLCGGGCRTLFPWGDDIDYNMNLFYYTKKGNKYDVEEPNLFGLSIAYDPYKMEIIDNKSFSKGGDGGCNVCGGFGEFLGYLSCSPYFNQVIDYEEEYLNGDFNFYRRIIRIGE